MIHDDALTTKFNFTERLFVEFLGDLVKLEDPFWLPVLGIRGDEDHIVFLAPFFKRIHVSVINLVRPVTKTTVDIQDTVVPR